MKNKEIRADARNAYHDNWGKYIGLNLLYFLVVFAFMIVCLIPILGYVAVVICMIPIAYGYTLNMVRLKRGETKKCSEFLSLGFKNFGRSWALYGWLLVKFLLYSLILFAGIFLIIILLGLAAVVESTALILIASVVGLVGMVGLYVFYFAKVMLYILPQTIAAYNPQKLPKDCVEYSAKLMKGNRLKYIGLMLSFTGWLILSSLTFGMGYIFLLPYMSLAVLSFYESLDKDNLENKPTVMGMDDVNAAVAKQQTEAVVVENN